MLTLRMSRATLERIRKHGEEQYPNECCGVLLGRPSDEGWSVETALTATNAHAGSTRSRYRIAPTELIGIERQARSAGMEIAGFYHSHPDHPAQWSATDFAEAHWLGCCYLITEVVQGKAAVTNSFMLTGTTEEEKRFEPQKIALDGQNRHGA